MNNYFPINGPHRQQGVASLIISLVLLVTITFVTIYTSRGVLMEQKVANNEFRGRMAFEAAEKGIEAAVGAIGQEWTLNSTLDADGNIVTTILETDTNNVIFDLVDNVTGVAPPDGIPDANSATLANGSSVDVTLTGEITDDLVRYNVVAVGLSDDSSATRTIRQTFVMVPPVPNTPDAPLLSRSAIVMGGSATISNPEGHSTIWAGSDVNVGSNNATTTAIANPTDANYPDCLGGSVRCGTTPSSSPDVLGLDIIGNDSSLANLSDDEFFQNFLGDSPTNFKQTRTDEVTTDLESFDGIAGGKVIWVEGDAAMASNPVYGSPTEPALIIIDGDLQLSGNPTFYGMVYVTGSITGTGNVDIFGSAVVNGVGTGGGSVDVEYNSQLLKLLNKASGAPTGSSGSWRDF